MKTLIGIVAAGLLVGVCAERFRVRASERM